jgi:hypothetical protein
VIRLGLALVPGVLAWSHFLWPAPISPALVPIAPLPIASLDSLPCRPWLDRAAAAAAAARLDEADRLLATARATCPTEPMVLRELAGLRFRQGRHAEAIALDEEYLRHAPGDSLGWQLLASSRYLTGNMDGALRAWNTIGRPRVDIVQVDGSHRVRFGVIANAIGVPDGAMLTPGRLALANRRVADIPALARAQVRYATVPTGEVEVRSAVVERATIGSIAQLLAVSAVGAVTRREARLTIASPLGAGERWTAQWRWESANPRRALRLDIPATIGLPGLATIEGSWERYRFADTASGLPLEQRRAATVGFNGWVSGSVEALAAARFERWSSEGDYLALSAGGALHSAGDRVVLMALAERGNALSNQEAYTRAQARLAWISRPSPGSPTWSARLGGDWASAAAPRSLRPIAGGGLGRSIPLRAHPFIIDHLLPTTRTGQGVVHGGLSGDRSVTRIGKLSITAGVFLDGAEVFTPADGAVRHRSFLDGGAGIRLGMAGFSLPMVRLDLARGLLAGRRWGLTIDFVQAWPPRPRSLR